MFRWLSVRKCRINALVSIVGVLVGGAIAGVSGMFLSIPVIAMMKVVFDRVEGLEAWGIFLGDQTPKEAKGSLFGLKKEKGTRREIETDLE